MRRITFNNFRWLSVSLQPVAVFELCCLSYSHGYQLTAETVAESHRFLFAFAPKEYVVLRLRTSSGPYASCLVSRKTPCSPPTHLAGTHGYV